VLTLSASGTPTSATSNGRQFVNAILDSGSDAHIVPDANLLMAIGGPITNAFVKPAGGDLIPATGIGALDLTSAEGKVIQLDDVLVVPGVTWALISVARLVADGSREVVFRQHECIIRDTESGEVFQVPMNARGAGIIALHYPDAVLDSTSANDSDVRSSPLSHEAEYEAAAVSVAADVNGDNDGHDDSSHGASDSNGSEGNVSNDDDGNTSNDDGSMPPLTTDSDGDSDGESDNDDDDVVANHETKVPIMASAVTRSGLTTDDSTTTTLPVDTDHAATSSTQVTATELAEFDIDPDAVITGSGNSGKKKLINLLHERLGHLNFVDVKAMLKGDMTCDGEKFKIAMSQTPDFCADCAKGKSRRAAMPLNKYTHRAVRNNFRVHIDVKGPLDVPSLSGAFYYAILKDDYSRFTYVIFLQRKGDLFDAFISWRNTVENQMDGATICKLRIDGGGENLSAEFKEEILKLGIEIEQTSADTPQQNAVAERSIGSIQALANAMHSQSGLAKKFWPFFVKAAVRARNRSPTSSLQEDVTPFERRFGHKPSIRRERVMGSLCYMHDPLAGSFDDKGIEGIFLGHSDNRATYIVFVPSQNKLYHSIHVSFDETHTASTHPDRANRLQIRTYQQAPYTFDQELLNWESGTATADSHQVTSAMIVNPLPADATSGVSGEDSIAQSSAPSTAPMPSTVVPMAHGNANDIDAIEDVTHADLTNANIDIESPNADAIFAQYGHLGHWSKLPPVVRLACIKAREQRMPGAHSASQIKKNTKDWWGRQVRSRSTINADPTVNMVGIDPLVERSSDAADIDATDNETSPSSTTNESIDSASPRRSTRIADAAQRRLDTLIAAVVQAHLPLVDHESVIAAASAAIINMCPRTIEDVEEWERSADHATRAYGQRWRAAINKEIDGLEANGCWDYIDILDLPAGAKILKSGHTFKIKSDGTLKDRFVAKGYSQRADIDFHDIYAAVVRTATLRTVLSICNLLDWDLAGIDFVQAFVNGDLTEEIYIHPPAGSEAASQGKLCRLRKTLYGLKQSARRWNEKLTTDLISIGFVQSEEDDCLFIMFEDNGRPCAFITVYVDDCVIACKPGTLVDIYKKLDALDVEYTRCDVLTRVLNITITRDRKNRKLTISQPDYSEKMLETFGMAGDDIRPAATPQVTGPSGKLDKTMCPSTPEEVEDMSSCPYRQLIGTLLHLTMQTRPDLAMSVGEQAKFMTNPGRQHWDASKRILRYVKGTINDGIVMDASNTSFDWASDGKLMLTNALHVYVDASYADDGKSRSTGGFVATLAGGIVSYKSTRLTDPPTSTAHAEIAAAYVGAQEATWLVKLLGDMGIGLTEPPVLLEDNKAAITHSHDANFHGRLRHLGTKYHFTRRQIKHGLLSMKHVDTEIQCADMFTKALPRGAFNTLRSICGINDARIDID
jgi:hypothetical protein